MANRDDSARSSLQLITAAGFAAYALFSFGWSLLPTALALPMVGQALLYLAVAVALLARVPWAGWFALGIATGGLVLDGVFLLGQPGAVAIPLLDTAAQAGLLALAVQLRRFASAADDRADRLTDTASAPIGWTFALTAAALPALGMGALAAPSAVFEGCFASPRIMAGHEQAWLTLTPVVALLALGLLARMRTLGLVVLFAGAIGGLVILFERWTSVTGWGYHFPYAIGTHQVMATVGQLLLVAALCPLAGPVSRALLRRDR